MTETIFQTVQTKTKELVVTAFYGGTERGRCVQIRVGEEHIQLSEEDTRKLIESLDDRLC